MKIKAFILIAALWANIAISDNSKTNQFFEFFNSVESLKANFSQTVYDEGFTLISSTSGSFAFQRPQKLLWHTKKPNDQILLLNNNELWQIDTELEQAVLQEKKDLAKTPLYWLINKPDSIQNTPKFSHSEGGIDWYLAANAYSQIEFGFVDGLLHAISLDNELGQIITIIFEQLVVNPAITPKTFELNIDSSFDVIK